MFSWSKLTIYLTDSLSVLIIDHKERCSCSRCLHDALMTLPFPLTFVFANLRHGQFGRQPGNTRSFIMMSKTQDSQVFRSIISGILINVMYLHSRLSAYTTGVLVGD